MTCRTQLLAAGAFAMTLLAMVVSRAITPVDKAQFDEVVGVGEG